jgi:hypothetical protein
MPYRIDHQRCREAAFLESLLKGRRVTLSAGHPFAGRSGVVIEIERTFFGPRPVVELDGDGHRCFIMRPDDARLQDLNDDDDAAAKNSK